MQFLYQNLQLYVAEIMEYATNLQQLVGEIPLGQNSARLSKYEKETGKQVAKTDDKSISGDLIGDIRSLIETARQNVAIAVNTGLTILYWQIGSRVHQDILKEKRADYGKKIVTTLSQELADDYGNNFNEKNLRRMIQFAEVFPDKEIVVSLIRQLSWTHFIALIPLKDDLRRNFYAEICRVERWSRNFTKPLSWRGNGWRQSLRRAAQNANNISGIA